SAMTCIGPSTRYSSCRNLSSSAEAEPTAFEPNARTAARTFAAVTPGALRQASVQPMSLRGPNSGLRWAVKLSGYDLSTGSSEDEPTLPDATIAGDDDHHGLSGQEQRALGVGQLDAEETMDPRFGAGVIEPDDA